MVQESDAPAQAVPNDGSPEPTWDASVLLAQYEPPRNPVSDTRANELFRSSSGDDIELQNPDEKKECPVDPSKLRIERNENGNPTEIRGAASETPLRTITYMPGTNIVAQITDNVPGSQPRTYTRQPDGSYTEEVQREDGSKSPMGRHDSLRVDNNGSILLRSPQEMTVHADHSFEHHMRDVGTMFNNPISETSEDGRTQTFFNRQRMDPDQKGKKLFTVSRDENQQVQKIEFYNASGQIAGVMERQPDGTFKHSQTSPSYYRPYVNPITNVEVDRENGNITYDLGSKNVKIPLTNRFAPAGEYKVLETTDGRRIYQRKHECSGF